MGEEFIKDGVDGFSKLPPNEQHYSLLEEISNYKLSNYSYGKPHPIVMFNKKYGGPYISIENNDIGIKVPCKDGYKFISGIDAKVSRDDFGCTNKSDEYPKITQERIQQFVKSTKSSGKILVLATSDTLHHNFDERNLVIED